MELQGKLKLVLADGSKEPHYLQMFSIIKPQSLRVVQQDGGQEVATNER